MDSTYHSVYWNLPPNANSFNGMLAYLNFTHCWCFVLLVLLLQGCRLDTVNSGAYGSVLVFVYSLSYYTISSLADYSFLGLLEGSGC